MAPVNHARLSLVAALLLALTASSVDAEAWTRTYGGPDRDQIWDARPTTDGGSIVVAQTMSFGAGALDLWVLKLASDGEIEWQAAYGGPLDEHAASIEQRADGGYVLVGQTRSFGSGYPLWMLRLDPLGAIEQQVVLRPSIANEIGRILVRRLRDDDMVLVTQFNAPGTGDGWIVRLDPAGNVLWQRRLELPQEDILVEIIETADGSLLTSGYTNQGSGTGNHAWLVRLDPAGGVLWQRSYSLPPMNSLIWSIRELADGSLLAGGSLLPSGGDEDLSVLHLSASGDILWERRIGGPGTDYGGWLVKTATGVVLSGLTSSFGAGDFDGLVVRLDDSGDVVSQAVFGGPAFDQLFGVIPMADGGYLAMGSTGSFGAGLQDLWMMRFDASDNPGASCDIRNDSDLVTRSSSSVVVDTTAVMVDTNAVPIATTGVRTVTNVASNLLCSGALLQLDADIKPGSCPNPLNLNRRGVIPAALTTFGADDAAQIDLASVTLEGVPALRCTLDDVSAPFDGADSCCGTPSPDGFLDVMCHFDSQAVGAALCARRVPPPVAGDTIDLELAARSLDGSTIRASDCARIQTFDCSTVPSPPGHRPLPAPIRPPRSLRR